jgi:hypothetical protein
MSHQTIDAKRRIDAVNDALIAGQMQTGKRFWVLDFGFWIISIPDLGFRICRRSDVFDHKSTSFILLCRFSFQPTKSVSLSNDSIYQNFRNNRIRTRVIWVESDG